MRYLLFIPLLSFICCSSQDLPKLQNISDRQELNYYLSNMTESIVLRKALYKGEFYLNLFKMDDSKATPEDLFEESDEILESILIAIIPDGDYYTRSELYKIEGLSNPVILDVLESGYPNIELIVNHGFEGQEKTESFKLEVELE